MFITSTVHCNVSEGVSSVNDTIADTVAFPAASAVIIPCVSTLTIAGSELDHDVLYSLFPSLLSRTIRESVTPTFKVFDVAFIKYTVSGLNSSSFFAHPEKTDSKRIKDKTAEAIFRNDLFIFIPFHLIV